MFISLLRNWRALLSIVVGVALAGCALPREQGVVGCGDHMYAYEEELRERRVITFDPLGPKFLRLSDEAREDGVGDGSAPTFIDNLVDIIEAKGKANGQKYFHVLALSGGGPWGAYGAGYLSAWPEDAGADQQSREEIDLVTGISTGALQSFLVAIGRDPRLLELTDNRLRQEYTERQAGDLIKKRFGGEIGSLFSNSLYSVEGLERVTDDVLTDYLPYFSDGNDQHPSRTMVGIVDVDQQRFVLVDLNGMANSLGLKQALKKECIRESLLASAAIPMAFPPRFIDGTMYVDGGARFGVFASMILRHKKVKAALIENQVKPFVSVIVNGNQSARSFLASGNEKTENWTLAVAEAAVANVADQIYRDSVFRIEHELRKEFGTWFVSRYTYLDNERIRQSLINECVSARTKIDPDMFDPDAMSCMYQLGRQDAKAGWLDEDQIPWARMP